MFTARNVSKRLECEPASSLYQAEHIGIVAKIAVSYREKGTPQ